MHSTTTPTKMNNPGVHNPSTLGGITYFGARERASANLSTQWRPNSNTEVYAEVFFTRYRNPNGEDFLIGLPGDSPSSAFTSVTDPSGTKELKTETICCFNLTSNQAFHDSTNTYQAATGVTWTGDNLTLSSELDYTYSKYKRLGVIVDTAIFDTANFDTNYQGSGTPYMGVATPAAWLVGSNYHPTQLFDQWNTQNGNEIDWRGDASYGLHESVLKTLYFGLRYSNRYGDNLADNGGAYSCYGGTNPTGAADPTVANSAACAPGWFNNTLTTTYPKLMSLAYGNDQFFAGERPWGIRTWMNANPSWTVANITTLRTAFGQPTTTPAADLSNTFSNREQGFTAYFKADYGLTIADMPLDGNFGVRVVDTKATQHAYITSFNNVTNASVYTPTTDSKEAAAWMPSFNAKLSITDELIARFALSRTVTRPTFAQYNPGLFLTAGSNTYANNGSAGNPNLAPVKSNNADLGLEYYFGKQDMLTATAFYRQIDGYIQSKNDLETYGVCGSPLIPCVYSVNRPYNSGQGYLEGVEVGYQQWLDMLPGIWSGLGLQANGTFIEGHFRDLHDGREGALCERLEVLLQPSPDVRIRPGVVPRVV